ncbi:MAG: hypothetical protein V8Q36_07055 [Anaerotignum sp.]
MRKKRKKQMEDIDLMEELEYYQPRKKRLEIPQKYVIAAVLILLAGAAFLFSPFLLSKISGWKIPNGLPHQIFVKESV